MITEITIYSDFEPDNHSLEFFGKDFNNGINIQLTHIAFEDTVSIKIMNNGEELLIPEFEISIEELKSAIKRI